MATKIEVAQGDITEQDVDAIVNAANNHLWMGSGVAGAIVLRGGAGIEDEAIRQGPIAIGEAVVTGGGRLPAKHVIHAAAMGEDGQTDAGKIRDATTAAMELAEQLGLHSLALPAIGTGVGGFPIDECARIMLKVVQRRGSRDGALPLVRFVLFDDAAHEAFARAMRR